MRWLSCSISFTPTASSLQTSTGSRHDGAPQRDQSPGKRRNANPLPAGCGVLLSVLPVHPAKAPRNGLPRPAGPLPQGVRQPPRLPERKEVVPLQRARNQAILLERLRGAAIRLKKITLRSNANILFASLLLTLDKQPNSGEKLTIGQIARANPSQNGGHL